MDFGLQFFPDVAPHTRSAEQYFAEALELTVLGEQLGFTSVRQVEHYFHPYGGYSPNPLVFLAAASQRTTAMRLVTGAVLPVFNHPLKLAGEIGMLDALSGGRLEVGFARAFLPHEFARFGISLDESRARFEEGIETIRRLLEEEDVALDGRFHSFPPTTSLPRPTQQPRPPFWVAAVSTAESFVNAGRMGHSVMAIPFASGAMRELLDAYRSAWREAGHPGEGRVMLGFHMVCHEDQATAEEIARGPLTRYNASLVDAASDWVEGTSSADYPGYDKIIAKLREDTFESLLESGAAWIGTPDRIAEQIQRFHDEVGGFEVSSLQVNFNDIDVGTARASMELFGREVLPRFASGSVPTTAGR